MAPGFVFRLRPLLDERKRIEETKRRAFARAAQAFEESSRELDRLTHALQAAERALHESALTGRVANLSVYDAHLRYLERIIDSHEAGNAVSASAVEHAAAELQSAHRDRRLVEKLKERRLQEYEREEARHDELELQETNARRRNTR